MNISKSTYASFDDALFAGTGFVWSIDSDGKLNSNNLIYNKE